MALTEIKTNSTELQNPKVEAEVYNNNKKCDWIDTYTDTPISKTKTVQQKWSMVDWPSKQREPKIISTRTKLTKHKLENKTKARCQLGNKAVKIKLINILRGKERKERKNRYAKLNRDR